MYKETLKATGWRSAPGICIVKSTAFVNVGCCESPYYIVSGIITVASSDFASVCEICSFICDDNKQ